MGDDEFYIGWQDGTPASYAQGRRTFFFGAFLTILLLVTGYLSVENKFVDSYFDDGNLTEIEGTIVTYPVFGLKTEIDGKKLTVPLVGFGKFDGLPILKMIRERARGVDVANLKVGLRGTMIRYQDKTWMELTEGAESIVSIEESIAADTQKIVTPGSQSISGEIIDPKCFFGAMNPAYKKIHRSCAIRCISGGMPPLLAIREAGSFVDYYFVKDKNGQPINQDVLQFVGRPITLSGQIEQIDDWKVIKMDVSSLARAVSISLDGQLALCGTF